MKGIHWCFDYSDDPSHVFDNRICYEGHRKKRKIESPPLQFDVACYMCVEVHNAHALKRGSNPQSWYLYKLYIIVTFIREEEEEFPLPGEIVRKIHSYVRSSEWEPPYAYHSIGRITSGQ